MLTLIILISIVALAIPSIKNLIPTSYFTWIASLNFIYSGLFTLNSLYIQSIGSGIGIYSGLLQVSMFSQSFDFLILILAGLILLSWPLIETNRARINNSSVFTTPTLVNGNTASAFQSTRSPVIGNSNTRASVNNLSTEYSLIINFSILGSILLTSSADLISMYLSIELQSFGVYILTTLYRDSNTATAAGLKYFLLGGLSSCFILLGCGLSYTFTGLTSLDSIYSILSVAYSLNNGLSAIPSSMVGLTFGLTLIIIGFLFKIAAAPLHHWSPGVYDGAPTIVTIFLTIMPKIAILTFLLEIFTQISLLSNTVVPSHDNILYILKNLLLFSSLLSLIIGSVVGLAQTRIKRLLAYSTISHVGFILLALSINDFQSIHSFIFYIVQYSITNLDVFLILISLSYITMLQTKPLSGTIQSFKDIEYISELKGVFYSNPLLSISLSICLFSMAGIPPLIGFFSKQYVLSSAIHASYYFLSIVAILTSVVSAAYYLKVIRFLHSPLTIMSGAAFPSSTEGADQYPKYVISNLNSLLISVLTLIILLFLIKPTFIINSTQLLSSVIFSY